jgi:hypothetical protein
MLCVALFSLVQFRSLTPVPESVPLMASISRRGGGFIADVKNRPDVKVVEVTQGNRQTLPGRIASWVKELLALANTP